MNNKDLVNLTNKIALAFSIILVYWVFIFSMIKVFNFKILRENMTTAFMISILGIIAILVGTVVINVMLNLTRIADNSEAHRITPHHFSIKKWLFLGILAFPLCFAALYLGDKATQQKKERLLINNAKQLIEEKPRLIEQLSHYTFTEDYLNNSRESITLLQKVDSNFPNIDVLVKDTINEETVILSIQQYTAFSNKQRQSKKVDFIHSTTAAERKYILSALDGKTKTSRYQKHKNNYKLYYPVKTNKGTVVLLLSDYLRYGKYGS